MNLSVTFRTSLVEPTKPNQFNDTIRTTLKLNYFNNPITYYTITIIDDKVIQEIKTHPSQVQLSSNFWTEFKLQHISWRSINYWRGRSHDYCKSRWRGKSHRPALTGSLRWLGQRSEQKIYKPDYNGKLSNHDWGSNELQRLCDIIAL